MEQSIPKSRKKADPLLTPFLLVVGAYCFWVLTLPLFPSLDGSLHLYYASVLGSLLSGAKAFSSYYFIRHILPPYALHYYFLIVTAHFFGYVFADKLLVCLIFLTTAFGFRYLARFLGPSGDVMSLFAIALLLNWPLGMGFYNYCLAIGMALWALGMWFRAVARRSHGLWTGFLLIVILMVLTHPVPALIVYVVIGADVARRVIVAARESRTSTRKTKFSWRRFFPDLAYMLAAWATVGYIALFLGAHRVLNNITQTYPRRDELRALVKLSTLAMFSGAQWTVLAYRVSLYLLLIAAIAMAFRGWKQRWQNRQIGPRETILFSSLALLAIIPILPPVMNGANYFAQRLVILVWLGSLAAAGGYARLSPRARNAAALCAVAYAMAILGLANQRIRPVAASIHKIESAPAYGNGRVGLTLSLPDAPDPKTLNYFPYYWAGTRYFRRTKSILLNGGWLYESYLPLGSKRDILTGAFTSEIQDSPGNAYQLLQQSQVARARIMPKVNLVVFTGETMPPNLTEVLHRLDDSEPSRQWRCDSDDWFSVCTASMTTLR